MRSMAIGILAGFSGESTELARRSIAELDMRRLNTGVKNVNIHSVRIDAKNGRGNASLVEQVSNRSH